mmetsp:Transcript_821/g.3324  ORF Transcript_821/g.3324 Transcript_821/m.3324 type:complete len:217 (+) Transcript_821:1176-1826(+)
MISVSNVLPGSTRRAEQTMSMCCQSALLMKAMRQRHDVICSNLMILSGGEYLARREDAQVVPMEATLGSRLHPQHQLRQHRMRPQHRSWAQTMPTNHIQKSGGVCAVRNSCSPPWRASFLPRRLTRLPPAPLHGPLQLQVAHPPSGLFVGQREVFWICWARIVPRLGWRCTPRVPCMSRLKALLPARPACAARRGHRCVARSRSGAPSVALQTSSC